MGRQTIKMLSKTAAWTYEEHFLGFNWHMFKIKPTLCPVIYRIRHKNTHLWRENKTGYWFCCGHATGNIPGPEFLACHAALPVSSVGTEDGVQPGYGLDKSTNPRPAVWLCNESVCVPFQATLQISISVNIWKSFPRGSEKSLVSLSSKTNRHVLLAVINYSIYSQSPWLLMKGLWPLLIWTGALQSSTVWLRAPDQPEKSVWSVSSGKRGSGVQRTDQMM